MDTEKIVQSLYAFKHTYLCDINIFISYRYSYRINILNKLRNKHNVLSLGATDSSGANIWAR